MRKKEIVSGCGLEQRVMIGSRYVNVGRIIVTLDGEPIIRASG